jgi:phenylacetate-CoA ligase
MIWNDEFETLPREALESLQLKRLQNTLQRVAATVPFYRDSFSKANIDIGTIRSLADLQRLPFTLKQDMRDNYPYGLFAVPLEQIVRIHASSGTTGKPTVVGYTRRDIDIWAEIDGPLLYGAAGVHKGDVIHNAYGYGLFTGGLGAHYGAEKHRRQQSSPCPAGRYQKADHDHAGFRLHRADLHPFLQPCTWLKRRREEGHQYPPISDCGWASTGAEPWSESDADREIEEKLNIKAIDIYGLSEILGPGVAIECIECPARPAYLGGPLHA